MVVEKQIREYDFRNPERLTRDNFLKIKMVYEEFGRQIALYLSGQLRMDVSVKTKDPVQLLYGEFINRHSPPTIFVIIDHPPLKAQSLIWLQPALVFFLLDRLFGGKGEEIEVKREITEIEQQVVMNLTIEFLKYLRESWQDIEEIEFTPKEVVQNPLSAQIVAEEEVVIKTDLSVRVGEKEGELSYCMPFISIEPLLPKLTTKPKLIKEEGESVSSMRKGVDLIPVQIVAELGRTRVSMGDIMRLSPGDVLRLSTKVRDGVILNVAGKSKFSATPGTVSGNIAVQITKVLKEEKEEGKEEFEAQHNVREDR